MDIPHSREYYKIPNVRLLHDADYIDKNIDRNEHPHLIKKYSKERNSSMHEDR